MPVPPLLPTVFRACARGLMAMRVGGLALCLLMAMLSVCLTPAAAQTPTPDTGPYPDMRALNRATMEVFQALKKRHRLKASEAQTLYAALRGHLRAGGEGMELNKVILRGLWRQCRGECMVAALIGFGALRDAGRDDPLTDLDGAMARTWDALTFPTSEAWQADLLRDEVAKLVADASAPESAPAP